MKDKKIISIEIANDLYEALRIRAFNHKASISKVIREILMENLAIELKQVDDKNAVWTTKR